MNERDPAQELVDRINARAQEACRAAFAAGKKAGAADEREACAALVEENDGLKWDAQGIPAAIRARAT